MTLPTPTVLAARRRRGLTLALFAYAASIFAALVFELTGAGRETAALAGTLGLHAAFLVFALFHRPAAHALLFMAMPLEPMMRTWAGSRFLTFVYGALALMALDLRGAWRRLLPLDAGFWMMAVVVMWMLLSLAWSPTPWAGLTYTMGLLGVLVAYVMPRGLWADREDLDAALRALVIGAVVAFALHVAVLPEAREGRLGAHRAMSSQDVGATFAVALMAALYLSPHARRRRWALRGAVALFALAIALTVGRGAAAGMLGGTLLLIVLSATGPRRWLRAAAFVAVVSGAYAVAYLHNQRAFSPRIARTLQTESIDRLSTGRLSIWSVAMAMVRDHPLLGVGAGSFPDEFDRYYRLSPAVHGFGRNPDTHSIPLRTAAEVGVPAALLYLGFVASCIAGAWRSRHAPGGVGGLAVGLTVCCVGMTSVGALYQPALWMGTGLGIWALRLLPPEASGRTRA